MGIADNVMEKIAKATLPAKPVRFQGEEHEFPEDPTSLLSEDIGKWMFTITAWEGYVIREQALADLETADVKSVYEAALRRAISQIKDRGKKTQHALEVEAFEVDSNLWALREKLDETQAEAKAWGQLQKIYEAQILVLSRELTRRFSTTQKEF